MLILTKYYQILIFTMLAIKKKYYIIFITIFYYFCKTAIGKSFYLKEFKQFNSRTLFVQLQNY